MGSVTFPSAGTWYDYLNGTTIMATGASQAFTLQPGEYHVFTSADIALPVTLVSFTGKNNGNMNLLSWKVDNEKGLSYYELQHSIDGQNFSPIAQIKATGNSNYSYSDNLVSSTSLVYYYRLKSMDKDGNFKYSTVLKISVQANGTFVNANPNPFKQKLVVTIESSTQDNATIIMRDVSGRQLLKENKTISTGTNVLELDDLGKLSKGIYLLTIIESQQMQSIKVVKGN
jgi:1,4-alpha-glucan branching enzyme